MKKCNCLFLNLIFKLQKKNCLNTFNDKKIVQAFN